MSTTKYNPAMDQDVFTAPRANGEQSPLEMLSALSVVFRRSRKLILYACVGTGLLAYGISFLLPNTYTATASFIPPSSSSTSSMAALVGQLSSMGGGGGMLGSAKTPGDLYVGILKSRSIAGSLVARLHLKDIYKSTKESQAEKTLASHTEFAVGAKDTIVTINVTEKDPVRARDIANGYLDALRSTSGGLALTENSQRRQFFEQRLALEKDELADAEVALKQTQEKSGLIAPAGQMASELGAIASLRSEISNREVRLASLRQDESDDNPDVMRVRSEIASLHAQLSQLENGPRTAGTAISTAQVPALQLDYVRRARDVKYHETLFEIIAKQYEAARLDEAHDPSLQILDRAIVPDTKSGPHRLIIAAVAGMLGLFVSVLWVLVQWILRERLQQDTAAGRHMTHAAD